MTPEQFEAAFLNELAGMLYDASVNLRSGREFVIWFKAQHEKLRATIRQMHSALVPVPKPEVKPNGRPETQQSKPAAGK